MQRYDYEAQLHILGQLHASKLQEAREETNQLRWELHNQLEQADSFEDRISKVHSELRAQQQETLWWKSRYESLLNSVQSPAVSAAHSACIQPDVLPLNSSVQPHGGVQDPHLWFLGRDSFRTTESSVAWQATPSRHPTIGGCSGAGQQLQNGIAWQGNESQWSLQTTAVCSSNVTVSDLRPSGVHSWPSHQVPCQPWDQSYDAGTISTEPLPSASKCAAREKAIAASKCAASKYAAREKAIACAYANARGLAST